MIRYLLGIDDTDNAESRGTGHLVRALADWLALSGPVIPEAVTRHQLLVDARIPFTSHNSSACLSLRTEGPEEVWNAARGFLLQESAPDADVGLCMAASDKVNQAVQAFGRLAKREVLTEPEAHRTAHEAGARLAKLTGTGGGIIGALAAVGLHHSGQDGRFLWLPGLRDLRGRHAVADVQRSARIDRVCTLAGLDLPADAMVDFGDWVRPVLHQGCATVFVQEKNHEWSILGKDEIKRLSN